MKHSFTDQQLTDAYEAALKEGSCGDTAADYMRAVVNHLPEPDWQTREVEVIDLEDVRKGDRVIIKTTHNSFYEVTITGVRNQSLYWEGNCIGNEYIARVYLFNRPIQHPDPEVHHFIRIDGDDYEAIPDSGRYQLIRSKWTSPQVVNVENITEWDELELTPKVVEDDR